jgi:hypothetical protein
VIHGTGRGSRKADGFTYSLFTAIASPLRQARSMFEKNLGQGNLMFLNKIVLVFQGEEKKIDRM